METAKYNVITSYLRFIKKKVIFIFFNVLMIVVIGIISMSIGSYPITLYEVFSILMKGLNKAYDPNNVQETVVWILRLPRITMGVMGGLGLGMAGAVMQGVLRNPLASPTTIGISAGASFGVALAILLGMGISGGRLLLVFNAFAFAMIPALVILGLARFKRTTPETMILAGIAMQFIFTAMTSLLQYLSQAEALKGMIVWMMGDLGRARWNDIFITFLVVTVCGSLLIWKSWDLDVISVGDATAKSLGINVDTTRLFLMIISSILTSTITCFTGIIGFIGLISPHVCRIIIGSDNIFLIPASGLFGAAFLLLADLVSRTIVAPIIIPVGIITAAVGGPLFLYLVIRKRKEYW